MTLTSFIALFNAAIVFGTVIMFGSMGEILTEKSGNLNLGVPGLMYMGGIASLTGSFLYERSVQTPNPVLCVLIPLICAFVASFLGSLIYAVLTITLRANQNVTGLTLTIFGSGIANFFGGSLVRLSGGVGQIAVRTTSSAFRATIPGLSSAFGVVSKLFFSYGFLVYVAIVTAVILQIFLSRSRTGLNLRAIGENPGTADAAGINVTLYKYMATCFGGALTGLGGMFYVMDYTKGTWSNDGGLETLGWLAVALVIFTNWRPRNAIWGAYVFGLCYWIYLYMPSGISATLSTWLGLTKATYMQSIYKMIPYLVTITVLILVSMRKKRENQAPGSLGLSYFREER